MEGRDWKIKKEEETRQRVGQSDRGRVRGGRKKDVGKRER